MGLIHPRNQPDQQGPASHNRVLSQIIWFLSNALIVFGLKAFYSAAPIEHLKILLTPVIALTSQWSGLAFTYESGVGYVHQDLGLYVVKSCSGGNFFIICFWFLALQMRSASMRAFAMLPIVALSALCATWLANSMRLTMAIAAAKGSPLFDLWQAGSLHRFEGVIIYSAVLFGIAVTLPMCMQWLGQEQPARQSEQSEGSSEAVSKSLSLALALYWIILLVVPLVNARSSIPLRENFTHFATVGGGSLTLFVVFVALMSTYRYKRRPER